MHILRGIGRLLRRVRVALLALVLASLLAIMIIRLLAPDPDRYFSAHRMIDGGVTLQYRFLTPLHMESRQKYPLVVFLHGSGEIGMDNRRPLAKIGGYFLHLQHRRAYPCFVLVPQCPPDYVWAENNLAGERRYVFEAESEPLRMTHALILALEKQYPIDPARIYLVGFSMGASGVWEMIARHPGYYAAAIPVAGFSSPWTAPRLRHTPVWAFHGAWDNRVPVSESREMAAAMRKAGCPVRYTEYRFTFHTCLGKVLRENDLLSWMFSQ